MSGKPGQAPAKKKELRYAQRVAWAGNAYHLGLNWRGMAALLLGEAVVVGFLLTWPHMFFREGFVGFALGALTGVLALGIARFDDPQVRGDLAEQWTAEALRKVRGWHITNGLRFHDGDLDHVVVTPCGLLAVETKYRFRQPDQRRLAAQRHGDLAAAQKAGRKTASLVRSISRALSVPVTPALVVWGKGAPALTDGYKRVGDVYVLDGEHPSLWSHLFNAPLVDPATRKQLQDQLETVQREQVAYAQQHGSSRRRLCWTEFRRGVREERRRVVVAIVVDFAAIRRRRRRHSPGSNRLSRC